MHVLIAGCGWLGLEVARRLRARGDRVTAVRRDPSALAGSGLEVVAADLADPASLAALPGDLDAVLALQAAGGGDPQAYRRAYLEVNGNLLRLVRERRLGAFVHSGSTGVFGQDGEVEETTPPRPGSPTGQVLAEAEALLMDAAGAGVPARLVRLSGLYGPGRTWMLDRFRSGQLRPPADGPGPWLNSCHREDAAAMLVAVLDRGRDGGVYHAIDARPLRRRELVDLVAGLLGAPVPGPGPVPPGPDRRVHGEASRRDLGLVLAYPSLAEGLAGA